MQFAPWLAALALATCCSFAHAANFSTVEIYSDANCASIPLVVTLEEESSGCIEVDGCNQTEINNSTYYYALRCAEDRFEYTARLFSGASYLLIDAFEEDGCESYLGSNVFLAAGTCQLASYVGERSEIASLYSDGSAVMYVYNDSACDSLSQVFDLNTSMISDHSCYSGYNKFYTTDYPGTNSGSSGSDSSGSSSALPADTSSASADSSSLSTGAIVGIVVGCVAVVACLVALILWRRGKKTKFDDFDSSDEAILAAGDKNFDMDLYAGHLTPRSGQKTDVSPRTGGSGSLVRGSGSSSMSGVWDDDAIVSARIPREKVLIQKLLSRGGYGEVYLGTFNGRLIAAKMLLPETRKSIRHVNDFLNEVKMMAAMDHPRIVEFVGVAWDSLADLCVVSEYMEGGDLRAWLYSQQEQQQPVGFDHDKVKIALHVAHALTYLHSLAPPVIHRDLKSKNILLSRELDAKLTDFGVSRERVDRTMTAGVGTSLWMAPEVMMGEKYDDKADMFSFGVVLSELDSHTLPYSHAKENSESGHKMPDTAILQLVTMGRLRVEFSSGGLESMVQLGMACTSVDPKDRPTAAEALYKLHTVLAHEVQ
ncbi:hypothetical protein BBJ28_00018102 [Nothophytophthora sp. Chile5]|nr:hypothetical protein BBJ28_00018102 [Nothophytophthora sp. Chile5]